MKTTLIPNGGVFLGLRCGFSDATKRNQKPTATGLLQELPVSSALHLDPADSGSIAVSLLLAGIFYSFPNSCGDGFFPPKHAY